MQENSRAAAVPTTSGRNTEELLKIEMATLRRELADGLKAHGEQVMREVRSLRTLSAPAAVIPSMVPEKPRHSPGPWVLAVAASLGAAVLGTLLWKEGQLLAAARAELMDSKATVALLTARLAPASPDLSVLPVPAGEIPLDGARIGALRDFVARVAAPGRRGTVEVRHYADANNAVPGKATESPAFTSALDELRSEHAAITIEVSAGQVDAQGNRVEMHWRAAP
jgi:hypothetical protein